MDAMFLFMMLKLRKVSATFSDECAIQSHILRAHRALEAQSLFDPRAGCATECPLALAVVWPHSLP